MEQVYLDELDTENSFFHFTNINGLQNISENGLRATIGINSNGVEDTEKVFFSKGKRGLLQISDVWIKWMMNNAFEMKDMYGFQQGQTTDDRKQNISEWSQEFLSRSYLNDETKKKLIFEFVYNKMKNATYLSLDLEDGYHYTHDDIDENKVRNINNRASNESAFLFQQEMYGSYSDSTSPTMDIWNMHTKSGVGIEPSLIKQIKTRNNQTDLFSIIEETYRTYHTDDHLDILPAFIEYGRKRRQEEQTHSREVSEMFDEHQAIEQRKQEDSSLNSMFSDGQKVTFQEKKSELGKMFEPSKGQQENYQKVNTMAKQNNNE